MMGFAALGELALGQSPTANKVLGVDVATYAITMNGVGLLHHKLLSAEPFAMTLTFNGVELARGRLGLQVVPGGGVRGLRAKAGGGGKGLRIRA